jgi:alginate O-acetyltransferase complex protein AlgI
VLFSSPPFLVFALLTVIVTNLKTDGLSDSFLYLALNLTFLLLFFGRLEAILLIVFTAWGYGMIRASRTEHRRAGVFGIVSSLLLFVILKKYSFLPGSLRLETIPSIVGLSYVLFRVLHLIIDTYQGQGRVPGGIRYFNYSLSCFSLVSGPFQRFEDHEASIQAHSHGDVVEDFSRICNGFLKIMVLAPVVLSAHLWFKQQTSVGGVMEAHLSTASKLLQSRADMRFTLGSIVAAMVWTIFLYLNFSGYTDIVIGWARLCKLELPENFNKPLRANSFLDFWNRWHMSMTGWFKTYLFTPSLKWLTVRRPERKFMLLNTVSAFVITFLLMGLWHGPGWAFGICGLLLALGAAVNHTYRELLRRRIGNLRMTELGKRSWYRIFAAGLTFTFITVVIAPFWMNDRDYLRLLGCLIGPSFFIFIALFIVTGIAVELVRSAVDKISQLWLQTKQARFAVISSSLSVAIRLNILLLAVLVDYRGVPDFIYKGF